MGFRDLLGVLKAEARPDPTHPSSNDLLKVQLGRKRASEAFPTIHNAHSWRRVTTGGFPSQQLIF